MRAAALVVAGLLLIPLAPSRVEALSIRDLIELSRAGLGDEVLLALIEVDKPVFPVDPATLRRLKEEGVSERVILAVVRSGRTTPESRDLQPPQVVHQHAPEPQVVVIEHRDAPAIREVPVPVAVPVYIPVAPRVPQKPPEPVYWGWGGKLRPDAWQPTPQPETGKLINIEQPIKPPLPIKR